MLTYPFHRLVTSISQAKRMDKLDTPFGTTSISMRIMPWDIDPYQELNNGRYLTLMDLGRFAHANRIDLPQVLKVNNWGLMVGAVSTRFRYRLTMFQKVQLHSKILYFDDRWFYFHQWFTSQKNGEQRINASFLVRAAVTSKEGIVTTERVIDQMKLDKETLLSQNQPSEWLEKWLQSDEIHKNIMENDL